MPNDITHEAYKSALSVPINNIENEQKGVNIDDYSKSLNRAHELRKFEIDNYWKRATYFWAFQIAAFALLGLIWQSYGKGEIGREALLVPASLGAVSAFVGYLSSKGSKFWQENWECHVDALEGIVEGKLTQVIFYTGKTPYSVSRLNQAFMLLIFLGWLSVFIFTAFDGVRCIFIEAHPWSSTCLLAASLIFLWFQVSHLEGRFQNISTDAKIRPYERTAIRQFIVRFTHMLANPTTQQTQTNSNAQEISLGSDSGLILRDTQLHETQDN